MAAVIDAIDDVTCEQVLYCANHIAPIYPYRLSPLAHADRGFFALPSVSFTEEEHHATKLSAGERSLPKRNPYIVVDTGKIAVLDLDACTACHITPCRYALRALLSASCSLYSSRPRPVTAC